ncbi:hypothetical protein N8T08_009221 [Aspergillus melleus]|uniref:Uncharacterized protein n=1 Tax=Aspergillus melleus TaxID=138277 RepID=A0ACC3AU46_9EURO|nr:hypothetical protein N8T08_009221 [Aspergillus melleus]
MSAPGTLSPGAYLAAGTPLIVTCAGFVGVRCAMNFRVYKRLLIADYVSMLGFAFVTIAFAMNHVIIQRFANPLGSLNWLNQVRFSFDILTCVWLTSEQVAVVITVIIAFELWTTKAPIMLVYVRIFGIKKWLEYVCYTSLAISGLAYICAMSPTFMRCDPNAKSATLEDLAYCTTAQDVLIFFLPMPLVYQLHLRPAKKLAVGAVFFSGILGIAASIASLYFKYRAYKGATSDTLSTMLCA